MSEEPEGEEQDEELEHEPEECYECGAPPGKMEWNKDEHAFVCSVCMAVQ